MLNVSLVMTAIMSLTMVGFGSLRKGIDQIFALGLCVLLERNSK